MSAFDHEVSHAAFLNQKDAILCLIKSMANGAFSEKELRNEASLIWLRICFDDSKQ
jgi:hypothetical protein